MNNLIELYFFLASLDGNSMFCVICFEQMQILILKPNATHVIIKLCDCVAQSWKQLGGINFNKHLKSVRESLVLNRNLSGCAVPLLQIERNEWTENNNNSRNSSWLSDRAIVPHRYDSQFTLKRLHALLWIWIALRCDTCTVQSCNPICGWAKMVFRFAIHFHFKRAWLYAMMCGCSAAIRMPVDRKMNARTLTRQRAAIDAYLHSLAPKTRWRTETKSNSKTVFISHILFAATPTSIVLPSDGGNSAYEWRTECAVRESRRRKRKGDGDGERIGSIYYCWDVLSLQSHSAGRALTTHAASSHRTSAHM